MVNSKKKGSRGERELAQFIRKQGYKARRGQQYAGSPESPDIVHNVTLGGLDIHIECKRTERFNAYDAIEQAEEDRGLDEIPTVFHKRNRGEWIVVMYAEDFFRFTDDPELAQPLPEEKHDES